MCGGPEIQGVAGGATRRGGALDHVLGQVHGEGSEALLGLVVQGARSAALRAEAPQDIEVTQLFEHLLQGNALSQVAEVHPRGRWACRAWRRPSRAVSSFRSRSLWMTFSKPKSLSAGVT